MRNISKSISLGVSILALGLFLNTFSSAEEMQMSHDHMKMDSAAGKTSTVKGEVIDIACYTAHGAKGEEHASCAGMCIDSGIPGGIVDAKGKIYIVLGENHKAPKDILKDMAGKQVKATGKVVSKGGSTFLIVNKIQEEKSSKSEMKSDMKSDMKHDESKEMKKMDSKEDKD